MNEPRNEGCRVTESLPGLRRQLLTLSSVYQRSSGYYREALRPVIRAAMARLEGRS